MYFPLLIFLFITTAFSASYSDGEEEVPTPFTNYDKEFPILATIYYQEGFSTPATTYYLAKEKVLAIIRRKFIENSNGYGEVAEEIIEYTSALESLHSKLTPQELVIEMLFDKSQGAVEFIVALLYSYKSHKFVPFSDIETMSKSETSHYAKSNLFKQVFQNFKCFVTSTVSISKHYPKTWPYNSFAVDEFLKVSEKLWNDKLLSLTNKILVPEQAKEWRLWGMNHFEFLKRFHSTKIKDNVLSEFKFLLKDYSGALIGITPLGIHFAKEMENLDSPGTPQLFQLFSALPPLLMIIPRSLFSCLNLNHCICPSSRILAWMVAS
jgi:hypothetical protein